MKNRLTSKIEDLTFDQKVQLQKLRNERFQSVVEISKWLVISIGAVISFLIIDVGNLKLEEFKADSSHKEKLLDSYLESTQTADPDLWTRKLRLIRQFSSDTLTINWAVKEEEYIKYKAALISLYKETNNIGSVLANRNLYGSEEWLNASKRYYQLYWAELPFYGESQPVIEAMINFKETLDVVTDKNDLEKWKLMNTALFRLSNTLRIESKILDEKDFMLK